MADLNERFDKVRKNIAKTDRILTAKEVMEQIAEILSGLTRQEIKDLATKTRNLENSSTGIEKRNLMEVAGHMLTYPGIDGIQPHRQPAVIITEIPPYTPTPVDPKKDPQGVFGEEPDKKYPKGKKKIRTRGQKISNDSFDYGKEYPGSGKMQSDLETAASIINNRKGLTDTDRAIINSMLERGGTREDIIRHLQLRIQEERRNIENKKQKRRYEHLLKECFVSIKEYLEKEFGNDIAKNFNMLPDPSRIHVVGAYDYLNIAGIGNSCGVFRSKEGDIYLSSAFLEKYDDGSMIGKVVSKDTIHEWPRIYREIKHLIIHEALHSMSIINYREEKNGDVSRRRVGLRHINENSGKSRGIGMNEGTTEKLAQEVLRYIYKEKEGLTNYKPCRNAYEKEQDILNALMADNPEIKQKDFYQAMLLRKYGDEKDIKGPTPLVEIIRKINGGKELNTAKRPYFYQIIINLMDYVNEKNTNDTDFIVDFIKTKNIAILQDKFRNIYDVVFDKRLLLNKEGTNFNETILKAYKSA